MRDGKRDLSLLAITLEIILYTTLHKAMGLKPSGVMAFSCFGIRAMKEALRAFRTFLDILILFDCFPESFEEIYIEPIQAWGFSILHFINHSTDLLFRHWLVNIVVVLSGDQLRDVLSELVNEPGSILQRFLCYTEEVLYKD